MQPTRYYAWLLSNWYGYLFGWQWLQPIHHAFLNLSLHALGYDNARFTGEEWFIKKILAKANPTICIDIGANVGAYTKMLLLSSTTDVYAIEPAASSFAALEKNTHGYEKRVHTIQAAISDHNGTGILHSRDALSEKATLAKQGTDFAIAEEVRLVTLDSLIAELGITKLDFIKIDTEGHELAVFTGMQKILTALQPKYIQFEFNHVHLYSNTTLYHLTQLLEGYTFYRLLPHGWTPIDPRKQASNIYMFSNIIAERK